MGPQLLLAKLEAIRQAQQQLVCLLLVGLKIGNLLLQLMRMTFLISYVLHSYVLEMPLLVSASVTLHTTAFSLFIYSYVPINMHL
jgi:hypothetical protein